MFGFVVANSEKLTTEQIERYRGCYCGLCRTLQSRHGQISRLTLNYDMTFLVIFLSAMYEPEETSGSGRCAPHPVHSRSWWTSSFTDYAADMNIALAYFDGMDDWRDDRRLLGLAETRALGGRYKTVQERWPEKCRVIEECLGRLAEIERRAGDSPDEASDCFGRLMGELFGVKDDPIWGGGIRRFGESLGRFIYMMDACVDFEKDVKRGRYNPLAAMYGGKLDSEEKIAILKMLIGECTAEFERLPIIQDVDILRNVLYSGVWTQYAIALKRERGKAEDDK